MPEPVRLSALARLLRDHPPTPPGAPTAPEEPDPHTEAQDAARAAALAAWEGKVPHRFRDARTDHPRLLHWAAWYARERDTCPSPYLGGNTGSGKTHAAYGALRAVAETGTRAYAWHALTFADLFGSLRGRAITDSEALLRRYRTVPLLLLDDVGAAHLTDWTEEVTYRLVNGRYEDCSPCLFTSNTPLEHLEPVVGGRVASRLMEMSGSLQIAIVGRDRRRDPPQGAVG